MRPKTLIIVGAALLLVIFAAIFFPKLHYVYRRPAIAFGEEYFSKLGQRQVGDTLEMYTDGFRQKQGDEWQRLLAQLDSFMANPENAVVHERYEKHMASVGAK
jgi:hypothetical protein